MLMLMRGCIIGATSSILKVSPRGCPAGAVEYKQFVCVYIYMKGPGSYITQFLEEWRVQTLVFFTIWLLLTLLQVYVLKKGPVFASAHSFLIAGLVSIS